MVSKKRLLAVILALVLAIIRTFIYTPSINTSRIQSHMLVFTPATLHKLQLQHAMGFADNFGNLPWLDALNKMDFIFWQ